MCGALARASIRCMLSTGSGSVDAERAFARVAGARRRAAVANRLRRRPAAWTRLAVADERRTALPGAAAAHGIRPIPVEAISATVEPARARLFDHCFRPRAAARQRWERLWLAEHRGAALPPISVVSVGGGAYAVRDGHHRVSVARARGALTIDAVVDGAGIW
jgi:hypothetical protein